MKVVLTEKSIADLIGIGLYIREHEPRRASAFVDDLERRCLGLGLFPRSYPLVPGREEAGIRRCAHRDYLIFYRIAESERCVTILHVLHGRQDYEAVVFAGG